MYIGIQRLRWVNKIKPLPKTHDTEAILTLKRSVARPHDTNHLGRTEWPQKYDAMRHAPDLSCGKKGMAGKGKRAGNRQLPESGSKAWIWSTTFAACCASGRNVTGRRRGVPAGPAFRPAIEAATVGATVAGTVGQGLGTSLRITSNDNTLKSPAKACRREPTPKAATLLPLTVDFGDAADCTTTDNSFTKFSNRCTAPSNSGSTDGEGTTPVDASDKKEKDDANMGANTTRAMTHITVKATIHRL